ncbi:MAG: DUF63 family protein [Candidatus Aenigmatarchaeota archaeon]
MIQDFIYRHFIALSGKYYTLPSTLIYALLFAITVFLVYKYVLKKMPFEVDKKFLYSLAPFIVLGGMTRVLRDAGFYEGFFFVTPGVYITIFFLGLGSLIASLGLEKYLERDWNPGYHVWMFAFGSLFSLLSLVQIIRIGLPNLRAMGMVLALVAGWSLAFYPVTKFFPRYLSRLNYFILISHLFDGSSTFVSLQYFNYFEEHVLPRFLIEYTGPWVMFPLKIAVIWSVLYSVDRLVEEEDLRTWLKIVILALGLGLAVRNVFRATMLV